MGLQCIRTLKIETSLIDQECVGNNVLRVINETNTTDGRGSVNTLSINNDVSTSEISDARKNQIIDVREKHDVPKIKTYYRKSSYDNIVIGV